jgi:hypothetical protein
MKLLASLLLLVASVASAGALTPAQYPALRADIAASADLAVLPNTVAGAQTVAALYNKVAAPKWVVWRTEVVVRDLYALPAWNWSAVNDLYIGKQRVWNWLIGTGGTLDPSLASTRAAIDLVWDDGTPQSTAQRATVYSVSKRRATRVEKLFAVGAGTPDSPATMTFEGTLDYEDVINARNTP